MSPGTCLLHKWLTFIPIPHRSHGGGYWGSFFQQLYTHIIAAEVCPAGLDTRGISTLSYYIDVHTLLRLAVTRKGT